MFYTAQDLRIRAGKDAPSPNAPTAAVKKSGTDWEYWTSQIDDHLKLQTVAKRCTFRESRKSPALRGFVAGRWALATTSLYPSTKIEHPQRAQNPAPGGVLSLNSDGPDSRRPTRVPTPSKYPRQGHFTSAPKPVHRADTAATGSLSMVAQFSFPEWMRASVRRMRLAAARGKQSTWLAPPMGG